MMAHSRPTKKKVAAKAKPVEAEAVEESTLLDDLTAEEVPEEVSAESEDGVEPGAVDDNSGLADAVEEDSEEVKAAKKKDGMFSGVSLRGEADTPHSETAEAAVEEVTTEEPDEPQPDDAAPSYFDEDEQVVARDSVIEESRDRAILTQDENVLAWELIGFYDHKGKRRSKWSLASQPPILRLENSEGAQVDFALTKNLTRQLARVFETVNRGYYGMNEAPEKDVAERPKGIMASLRWWVKSNSSAAGIMGVLAVLTVLYFIATL